MKIVKTLKELNELRSNLPKENIGLVPTMGNIHKGHLSLIEKSFRDNQYTFVTIFVNPKQFSATEDFKTYPRTLYKDSEEIHGLEMKLQRTFPEREIIIFSPQGTKDIYPKDYSTHISVSGISSKLCGPSRENHFEGVTTVVYRLLSLINPKESYFGQKDYQQLLIIKRMVKDLNINVLITSCPIIRDQEGLALSSRNQFLTPPEREKSLTLPKTIQASAYLFQNNPLEYAMEKFLQLKAETLENKSWEYLVFLDAETLEEVTPETSHYFIAGAYKATGARLIDNKIIERKYV